GCGRSLAVQCCNVAVVLDFSKYLNQALDVDPHAKLARVQPGLILDHLRHPAEEQYQLTFGPDPSTHDHCTFGGMIGNNSCGVRSVMAAWNGPGPRMSDNVHELEVLLYDGSRLRVQKGTSGDEEIDRRLTDLRDRYAALIRDRYPDIPRRVSGYNLDDLLPENGFDIAAALTGTEGTCVTIIEATVHLIPSPKHRSLLVLGWNSEYEAADHVMTVLEHKPTGLEGVDHVLVEDMKAVGLHPEDVELMPEGRGWLVLELGGSLSGEHGDGESRAELLPKMFGPELIDAFREFKSIWDPDWKMNPGKVVDAYRITDNLRLGPNYAPPKLKTHFAFEKDH